MFSLGTVIVEITDLESLLDWVRSLDIETRKRLRDCLDEPTDRGGWSEDDFERALVEEGILARTSCPPSLSAWKAFVIEGEPLSETILRERG